MKEQFIIRFTDSDIRYQAEVKAFDRDGEIVYDVYYTLVPYVHPAKRVQVYAGSGSGPVFYWRQRVISKDEELLSKEFIEAIGFAIEQAEK